MRDMIKKVGKLAVVATLVAAAYGFFAPGTTVAGKGKGGGGTPPPCGCAVKIVLPDGTVCTLESCGSDCVYVCTLP